MNAETQKLLSDIAKCVGCKIEFKDGKPTRVFSDEFKSFHFLNFNQPDSELIFDALQKIGLVALKRRGRQPFDFPWYLNRPYEWEFAGETAYKSRRIMKQKLNLEWCSNLWALCAYALLPCRATFVNFLSRHPEKIKLMPLVIYGNWKTRFVKCCRKVFRVFFPKLS
jgi:hypothetical protein